MSGTDNRLGESDKRRNEGTAKNPTISGGLHQYTAFAGGTRTWDHMGSLVGDETGKGYQYDALGRLALVWSGAVGSSSVVSTTTYDALDRRTTQYGRKFICPTWIVGANGRKALVNVVWIIDCSGVPRIVTVLVQK